MNNRVTAIILAAGSGSRMKMDITKQKILVADESILRRTVRIFNECNDVDSIIVVVRSDELDFAKTQLSSFDKVIKITEGGSTRAESAKLGFSFVEKSADYVSIHDCARCFVTSDMISKVIQDAKKYGAATASCRVTDTVKRIGNDGKISETLSRNSLVLVQTPQVFRVDLYKNALDMVDILNTELTDDNMLLENIGIRPHCTDTGKNNIKITTQEDFVFARFLLNGEK